MDYVEVSECLFGRRLQFFEKEIEMVTLTLQGLSVILPFVSLK